MAILFNKKNVSRRLGSAAILSVPFPGRGGRSYIIYKKKKNKKNYGRVYKRASDLIGDGARRPVEHDWTTRQNVRQTTDILDASLYIYVRYI